MIVQHNIPFRGVSANTKSNNKKPNSTSQVSFMGQSPIQGKHVAAGIAGAGVLAIAGAKIKPIAKFFKSILKKTSDEIKQVDVSYLKGVDLEADFKTRFMKNCIARVKNPFRDVINKEGKPTRIVDNFPPNGYMLTGPKSEAREERFNWMIDELKNAGAEVIDPSDGKQSKFAQLSDAWWGMWKNHSDEEFKKTGKFKVFVVRGLDEIGQPPNYPDGWFKFPDGCLFKDSPDTNDSCRRHGVMLLYTCTNTDKVDPAVIRCGRINVNNCPLPKEHESLGIWKDYLTEIKSYHPSVVVNRLAVARNILSKKGEDVMKEMEPNFAYSIPYISPKFTEPVKKWQKYINKMSENVDRWKCNKYLLDDLDYLEGNLTNSPKDKEKYNTIYKMMEDIQRPEDLPLWKKHIQCKKDHIHIAYVD